MKSFGPFRSMLVVFINVNKLKSHSRLHVQVIPIMQTGVGLMLFYTRLANRSCGFVMVICVDVAH